MRQRIEYVNHWMMLNSENPQPPSVSLRERTQESHEFLESRLALGQVGATPEDYKLYVIAMLGWLRPIEAELWDGAWARDLHPGLRSAKCSWLESDLRGFGLDEDSISRTALCPIPLRVESDASKYGVAYVIEGAQLGGQVLRKRFGDRMPAYQCRWLEGYGRRTASLWRGFLESLNHRIDDDRSRELASQAALETFGHLYDWFHERGAAW